MAAILKFTEGAGVGDYIAVGGGGEKTLIRAVNSLHV